MTITHTGALPRPQRRILLYRDLPRTVGKLVVSIILDCFLIKKNIEPIDRLTPLVTKHKSDGIHLGFETCPFKRVILYKNHRKILNLEETVNCHSPILYIKNDVAKALTSPGITFSFDDALVE